MTDLQTLTAQRDDLLEKIREIEENCEGIENENNAQRVQALNLEHAPKQVFLILIQKSQIC